MRMGDIIIPDAPADEPAVEWRRLGKAIASVRRTIRQLRTRTAREVEASRGVDLRRPPTAAR
jgi:phosphocarrier protein FPr